MTRALVVMSMFGLVLSTGCADTDAPPVPTGPAPSGLVGVQQADADDIRDLIEALFPRGLQQAAFARFDNVERQVDRDNAEVAAKMAVNLIAFTVEKWEAGELNDPPTGIVSSTEAAVGRLVDLLFAFVGRDAPGAEDVLTGEVDGAVELVDSEGETVVTSDTTAGVEIPEDAVDETVLITVVRQSDGPCLPTGLDQFEGCYAFDVTPDVTFGTEVTVGVCLDPALTPSDPRFDRLLLHKFDPDNAQLGVVPLPEAPANFLDCSGFTTASNADASGLVRFARAGWRTLQRHVLGRLAPARLHAIDTGAGGLTINFSDIGWAVQPELAFDSDVDGDFDVYVSNADAGHGFVGLTTDPASDFNPKWSPDTSAIAFGTTRDGDLEIYVMNPDGTGLVRVTNRPGYDLAHSWSPDGTEIAFSSNRSPVTAGLGIFRMNADGSGAPTFLADAAGSPHFSPDGTQVAFEKASPVDGSLEIAVVDVDGTGETFLTSDPSSAARPTWSPDGTKIAFTSTRDGNAEIYVMDADGSNQVNLTNHPALDSQPVWSPDGSMIAFQSTRDGDLEIWIMNADGTGPTQVTDNGATDRNADWKAAPATQ